MDPSGVGVFSKCPLTVCVWADKNVGYDDDIHHTAHALKELMYFARLSVSRTDGRKRFVYDSCRGETE